MSDTMFFPWLSCGVVLTLASALVIARFTDRDRARRWAIGILAANFLTLLIASLVLNYSNTERLVEPFGQLFAPFAMDALNAIPLALYAALSLGLALLTPKRKLTSQWLAGILWLDGATTAAYAANNLLVFLLAWAATLVPFLWANLFALPHAAESQDGALPRYAKAILILSWLFLCAGTGCLIAAAPSTDWSAALSFATVRAGQSPLLLVAFVCFMCAVFLRKGLFPAQSWVLTGFERGPLLPLTLLLNGHLGAFLFARIVLPLLPDIALRAAPLIANLCLLAAGYAALLALVQRNPRRLLGLVFVCQSAFLLTGLQSNSATGIAGSLILWQVVAVSISMLTAVYAGLEARLGEALSGHGFLGLALRAPRLAVFFFVGGVAFAGLPLTLGFPAEDLLLQGTLAMGPYLGVVLPIVTALNAFSVMRLFARVFLGRPAAAAEVITDALPRERWVLTAALLFLVLGGLFPAALTKLPARAAERLVQAVEIHHIATLPQSR